MENPTKNNGHNIEEMKVKGTTSNTNCDVMENIIVNHNFSQGLDSWHPNSCEAYVVPPQSGNAEGMSTNLGGGYVVVTNRKECWQGLEQDIASRVSPGSPYTVSACVGVSGCEGSSDVLATLKLEYKGSNTQYLFIGRIPVSKGRWETLKGTFTLSSMPDRAVFYLEGPSPGVELLIKSVVISCPSSMNKGRRCADGDENIILNPTFEDGLNNWSGRSCKVVLHDSMADGKIVPQSGKVFAAATERTQTWNGIQQDISGRVKRKMAYEVTAIVRIYGNNVTTANIQATLWVRNPDKREQYIGISSVQATDKDWAQLQGKFLINGSPSSIVLYLEGPPPGTDILLNSLVVRHAPKTSPSPPPVIENAAFGVNIIQNSELTDGDRKSVV